MFDNIGGKIKGLAKFVCWVGIIISVIAGIVLMVQGSEVNSYYYSGGAGTGLIAGGLMTMILGSLLSWLGSLTLYGFGELVENSAECVSELKRQNRTMDDIKNMAADIGKNPERKEGPAGTYQKLPKEDQSGKPENPPADSPAVHPGTDEFGWKTGDDPRFVYCPGCNARYSVDYMKYRDACKECGYPRKRQ